MDPRVDPDSSSGLLGLCPAGFGGAVGALLRTRTARVPLLVAGEAGTGKRSFVRVAGRLAAPGPVVEVDCAALTDENTEERLFGHRRSGPGQKGLVREANGGTLILLHVDSLPPLAQERILHLLESCEVKPVGSRVPETVRVRLAATTRRDLWTLVEAGQFDAGLRDRLWARPVVLGPLRERPEAIATMAAHFAHPMGIAHDAMTALLAAEWPGNIRELRQRIRSACAKAGTTGRTVLLAGDL